MAEAHADLNITNADFDRVIGHLNAALVEAGAADGAIRDVLTAVNALRDEVVQSSSETGLGRMATTGTPTGRHRHGR